jgi:hypothetical protein
MMNRLPLVPRILLPVFLVGCQGVGEIGGKGGSAPGDGSGGSGIPVLTGGGGSSGGNSSGSSGLPCDVQALLATRCTSCHGSTPLPGVPMSLLTLADLGAPSRTDPTRTVAQLSLARMQSTSQPMPPAPYPPATSSEIAAFASWVSGGLKAPACGSSGAGGAGGADAGVSGVDARTGAGGATAATGLPCDVQAVMSAACTSCHSSPPLAGVPISLVTYADLTAPSHSDPTRNAAQLSVVRMQSTTMPMPPAPGTPATAAQISTLSSWIAAGYPRGTCGSAGGDGGAGDAGDPYGTPPKCTSGKMTPQGGGSPTMDPGQACVSCHASTGGEAPRFAIAGTVYPTAHEPDNCNGVNGGTAGAAVVIVGANGQTVTLTPNTVGNFYYQGALSTPFTAKVTYMGRERIMSDAQTNADCNSCHTQNGANGAPGRIMLP